MNRPLKRSAKLIILSLVFFSLTLLSKLTTTPALAQEFSYGQAFVVSDEEAVTGDIISRNAEGQYVRSNLDLSNQVIGVLSEDLTILYEEAEGVGSPIAMGGTTLVNVSTINGSIGPGDFIIPSPLEGKGQRASSPNGFMVGIALDSFTESDGTQQTINGQQVGVGSISISVELRPLGPTQAGALSNLIDQLANLVFFSYQTPQQAEILFRYLAAAIVAAVSIAIGFRAFGGSITNGIEAMGRNPLARRQIQSMIILNAGLILIISIAGIVLSLAILRF